MALISVIIATHNRAGWLPRAVTSAQEAGTDIEVVVVDDASTDETPDVCKTFQGVKVVRLERNVHLGAARNVGIRASTGEYLAFLDDDDRRLPGSLDAQAQTLRAHPDASFIYGPVLYGDPESCEPTGDLREAPYSGDIFWTLLKCNFIHVNTVLARRRCVEEVGLFHTSLRGVEDWHLWLRLAERYQVLASDQPVGIYRMPDRSTNQMSNNRIEACRMSAKAQSLGLRLSRARAATFSERRMVRRSLLNYLSYDLLHEAQLMINQSKFMHASRHVLTALQLNPFGVLTPRNLIRLQRRVITQSSV